jgi:hypothetical protein
MRKIDVGLIESKKICTNTPYFLGVSFGCLGSNEYQMRLGFILFQVVLTIR